MSENFGGRGGREVGEDRGGGSYHGPGPSGKEKQQVTGNLKLGEKYSSKAAQSRLMAGK